MVAVVTERSDGTCTIYTGFLRRERSVFAAKQVVEAEFEAVAWSELAGGVWVARDPASRGE